MRKDDVKIGGIYYATVSQKRVMVKIVAVHNWGGWIAENLATGRTIRIRTGGRLSQQK